VRILVLLTSSEPDHFQRFQRSLERPDLIDFLQDGLIGENAKVPGPGGPHPLVYADYVASGRALRQVETFIMNEILPFYANSHTEASFCGQLMTRLREQARKIVLKSFGGDENYDVIFTGSGATAGINRLVKLLDLPSSEQSERDTQARKTVVLVGPYEHHSNILPWRETGATVIEIPEAIDGGPDIDALKNILKSKAGHRVIGAFSAMSNVTGIVTDVTAVTRVLKAHGAISIWDYAGGAPYLPIDVAGEKDAEIDAVVVSPHKFIGGPGASGILMLRRQSVVAKKPSSPGGGTVSFVSPWAHNYSSIIVAREEAGTPNVVGDLRAALCIMIKDAIGLPYMTARLEKLAKRAEAVWRKNSNLHLLGNFRARRMPVFSFKVTGANGEIIHQQLVTRMLSDFYGVQARGGCACAGPYAHHLLKIDHAQSEAIRAAVLSGQEIEKPGWTRVGFSILMSDEKVDHIIRAVDSVARATCAQRAQYQADESTARFSLGLSYV
jgi:selenocysteine lyase/cysteine desulfurase